MAEPRKASRKVSAAGSKHEQKHEASAASSNEIEEVVLTVNKATHEVVNIARLDKTGHRHDLLEEDCAELAGRHVIGQLVDALDEAYRAGVAGGLGAESDEENVDDDILSWRLLVSRSVERSVDQLGLRRMLLRPVLLPSLLQHQIEQVPVGEAQRRRPIAHAPRNGASSHI